MRRALADQLIDLMILDLKLADEDGLELMQHIGAPTGVPIIVLTGHRRDETDRVVGLELGADDYMMKPFGLRELLARVHAVLRRAQAGERRARQQDKRVRYRFDDWMSRGTVAHTIADPALPPSADKVSIPPGMLFSGARTAPRPISDPDFAGHIERGLHETVRL